MQKMKENVIMDEQMHARAYCYMRRNVVVSVTELRGCYTGKQRNNTVTGLTLQCVT